MKFAAFPKFALLSVSCCLAAALAGCGSSNPIQLTQGNWSIAGTSNEDFVKRSSSVKRNISIKPNGSIPVFFYVGGNLTQSGANVSGTMHIFSEFSECFDPSIAVAFSGKVDGNQLVLTSVALEQQVITVTSTITNSSSLTGTYTVSGGCDDGDSGNLTANSVPLINGTWTGTLSNTAARSNGAAEATISMALTQATSASTDGTFPLSGTVSYANSVCSVGGTLDAGNSFIAGQYLMINANTTDQDEEDGSFTYAFVLLDSATAPAHMTGEYDVNTGFCSGDVQNLTLDKQ